jgi:spermidine synthase
VTLDRADTPEGALELRRRGDSDYLITVGGRVLMTSSAHRSEDALAEMACNAIHDRARSRVLLGGLGMAYTLRATLDNLPDSASITVVELNPKVVEWCREPLAPLTDSAISDPRVTVEIGDVARAISESKAASWDAIILDLYEGPHEASQSPYDPFYGKDALAHSAKALSPRGVLAVWSEDPDLAFERNLVAAGFSLEKNASGKGGRRHVVYLGRR